MWAHARDKYVYTFYADRWFHSKPYASFMVHRSVVKERRLTCAETVRTNKYIADKRVNIFKQFVPRSVRSSLCLSHWAQMLWDVSGNLISMQENRVSACLVCARLLFLLAPLRGACDNTNELWGTKIARHQVIFPPFLITRLNERGEFVMVGVAKFGGDVSIQDRCCKAGLCEWKMPTVEQVDSAEVWMMKHVKVWLSKFQPWLEKLTFMNVVDVFISVPWIH